MDRKIYELNSEITQKKSCFYLRVLYITISRLQIMLQFSKAKEAILADYKKEENKSITIRVCTNVKRAGMEGIVLHCTEIGLIIIRFFSTLKTAKPINTAARA
jgi:aspartate/glutamate racemase